MLETYLDPTEYKGCIPGEEIGDKLSEASRVVDSLTFNRIVKTGFSELTKFQQELIKEAVAKQADFAYSNAELLDSPLAAYSIAGVSMHFDRSKLVNIGSVTTSREVYGLLMQTGLCYGGIS